MAVGGKVRRNVGLKFQFGYGSLISYDILFCVPFLPWIILFWDNVLFAPSHIPILDSRHFHSRETSPTSWFMGVIFLGFLDLWVQFFANSRIYGCHIWTFPNLWEMVQGTEWCNPVSPSTKLPLGEITKGWKKKNDRKKQERRWMPMKTKIGNVTRTGRKWTRERIKRLDHAIFMYNHAIQGNLQE